MSKDVMIDDLEERVDLLERDMGDVKEQVFGRLCAICQRRLEGRRDKTYCSGSCRSKAWRIRRRADDRSFSEI